MTDLLCVCLVFEDDTNVEDALVLVLVSVRLGEERLRDSISNRQGEMDDDD